MTKLHVKRWTLLRDGKNILTSNDHGTILDYLYLTPTPYNTLEENGFSIRDNHAVIEKLAEKAKNN